MTSRRTSFLPGPGCFHLLADGDLVPGANQPRDVVLGRVVGNAAHRHGLALLLVARGEGDLQDARREDRVVVKKLVKVAQAEQQQRRRDAASSRRDTAASMVWSVRS